MIYLSTKYGDGMYVAEVHDTDRVRTVHQFEGKTQLDAYMNLCLYLATQIRNIEDQIKNDTKNFIKRMKKNS